jgi:hypothetical protein
MNRSSLFWAVACCISLAEVLPILSMTAAENPDKEHRMQECAGKKITVILTVPDSAWKIAVNAVYQVRDEIWVVSTVSRDPNAIGLQVISTVRDSVEIDPNRDGLRLGHRRHLLEIALLAAINLDTGLGMVS